MSDKPPRPRNASRTTQPTTPRTPPRPKSARAAAAAARERQEAADRRRERWLRAALIGGVLLAVVALSLVAFLRDRSAQTEAAGAPVPAGAAGVGAGIAVGPADAPQLELWEDFQCPACRDLEERLGATINGLVQAGDLRVVYHPLSFLDRNLGNDSSRRAAAASGCAADAGVFPAYHDAVFAGQPEEEGAGYTDEQLLGFGREAGITGAAYDSFVACVNDGTYEGWVRQVADSQQDAQITQTPTLVLEGRELEGAALTPAGLTAAVTTAGIGPE